VLRTVNDELSLWDAILPPELLVLPDELGRVDGLGTVKLVSGLVAAKIGGRDRCIVVVQRTPVPAGDHRALRVAVSPVPAELSCGRGVDAATRRCGQLRKPSGSNA
jgi:hypothetical protein